MDDKILKSILENKCKKFSELNYTEAKLLDELITGEYGSGDDFYQFEIEKIEEPNGDIAIIISVFDDRLFRQINPLTDSIIIKKNSFA